MAENPVDYLQNPMYPSSARGTKPLDVATWDAVYEDGYRAALDARRNGHNTDNASLFILALGQHRNWPQTEDAPQFFEYAGAFEDGVQAAVGR